MGARCPRVADYHQEPNDAVFEALADKSLLSVGISAIRTQQRPLNTVQPKGATIALGCLTHHGFSNNPHGQPEREVEMRSTSPSNFLALCAAIIPHRLSTGKRCQRHSDHLRR